MPCLLVAIVIIVIIIILANSGGQSQTNADAGQEEEGPSPVEQRCLSAMEEGQPATEEGSTVTLASPAIEFEERGKLEGKKIVLIGRTGAGKSSLINMIVGKHVLAVDPVASTTHWIEGVPVRYGQERVVLVDTPGYGEAFTATRYREGILAWLRKNRPTVALLVFVVQADAKAHADDKALLDDVFRTFGYMPILIVLNQVDKLPPVRQPLQTNSWASEQRLDGLKSCNIQKKVAEIKRQFESATIVVEPVAAVQPPFNRQRVVQLLAEQMRLSHPEQVAGHDPATTSGTSSGPAGNG